MFRLSQLARTSPLSRAGYSNCRDAKTLSGNGTLNASIASPIACRASTLPPHRHFATQSSKGGKSSKPRGSGRANIEYNDSVNNKPASTVVHRASPTPSSSEKKESITDFIKRLRSNKYLRIAQITSLLYLFYLGYQMYDDVQSSPEEDRVYKEKKYARKFFSSFGLTNTEWFKSRWGFTPEELARYGLETKIEASADPTAAAALDGHPLSKDGVVLVPKEVRSMQAIFKVDPSTAAALPPSHIKDAVTAEGAAETVALGTAPSGVPISAVGVYGEKRLRNDVNAYSEQDKHNSRHGGPIRYHTNVDYPTKLSSDSESDARVFRFRTPEEQAILEAEAAALFRELNSTQESGKEYFDKNGNPVAFHLTADPMSPLLSQVFSPPSQHLTPATRAAHAHATHASVCQLSGACCCDAWFLQPNTPENVLAISPASLQQRFDYQRPPSLFATLSPAAQHTLSTLPIILHPYFLRLPMEPHFLGYLQGLGMYGKGETLPFTPFPVSLTPQPEREPSFMDKFKDFAFVQRVREFRGAMKRLLARKDSMSSTDVQECERLNSKYFGTRAVDKLLGAVAGGEQGSVGSQGGLAAEDLLNAPFGLPVGIYRDPVTGNSRAVQKIPIPDASGNYHLHMHNPYEPSQELYIPEYAIHNKSIRIPDGFPDNQFVVQNMNTEVRLPLHDNRVMNLLLLRSVQGLALLTDCTREQEGHTKEQDYYAEAPHAHTHASGGLAGAGSEVPPLTPTGTPVAGAPSAGTAPSVLRSVWEAVRGLSLSSPHEDAIKPVSTSPAPTTTTTTSAPTPPPSHSGIPSTAEALIARVDALVAELRELPFLRDLASVQRGDAAPGAAMGLYERVGGLTSTLQGLFAKAPATNTHPDAAIATASATATDGGAAAELDSIAAELQQLFKCEGEHAAVINGAHTAGAGISVGDMLPQSLSLPSTLSLPSQASANHSTTTNAAGVAVGAEGADAAEDVELGRLHRALNTVFDTHGATDGSLQYFMLGNGEVLNSDGEKFSSLDEVPVEHIPLLPFALRVLRDPTAKHWEPSPITWYDKFKWVFNTCCLPLAPLRLTATAVLVLSFWFVSKLSLIGLDTSKENGYGMATPRARWRHALLQPAGWLARMLLFVNGYYRIRTLGRAAKATEAPIIVANHITIVDAALLFFVNGICPMFIAKAGVLELPLFKDIMLANGSILLDRRSSTSRGDTQREINRRALHNVSCGPDDLAYPHLVIFPEGTTTSGHALIDFKLGAFRPGTPVQPVVLRYPHKYFNPSYAGSDKTGIILATRLLTQFVNHAEIEFLPVHVPSAREKQDPLYVLIFLVIITLFTHLLHVFLLPIRILFLILRSLFARNVRKRMALALAVPTVDMLAY